MLYVVALGANIGNTRSSFARAIELIDIQIGPVTKRSSWHITQPVLHPECPTLGQSDFLNAAVLVESELTPPQMLQELFKIEKQLGRNRDQEEVRWGPRVIDLDIITAEQMVILSETLTIPHPLMDSREFVLAPMVEILPDWIHPVLGRSALELLSDLRHRQLSEAVMEKNKVANRKAG